MSNWSADDLFRWWIVQQQGAVMVHLGKITNPVSGKVERDLETARLLIDLIAAMETKTKGNLSAEDERFLSGVLTNLRLNFVQEASHPDSPEAGAGAASEPPAEGAPPGEGAAAAEGKRDAEDGAPGNMDAQS